MELRSLKDYMNINFSLPAGSTTIGNDNISEDVKEYLISTFPEWFVETSVAQEKAIQDEKIWKAEAIKANAEGREIPSNPFESDAMKTTDLFKDVDAITNQEAKVKVTNNDNKGKTKKK